MIKETIPSLRAMLGLAVWISFFSVLSPIESFGIDIPTVDAAANQDQAAHAPPESATQDHAVSAQDDHAVSSVEEHATEGEGHGPLPPTWLVIPFVAILLLIAIGPLSFPHHWHHHYPKYSIGLGIVVLACYVFVLESPTPMFHATAEFLSFIALVASLFIAASGAFINLNAEGTPRNNVILLFIASIFANLIATTGAAMLFIRSYMRLNKGRLKAYHIVFFIFIVANVGGALTPIGDPPLFLGFLRGVPFFWTLAHVWYIWLPATAMILGVFYYMDSKNTLKSPNRIPNQPLFFIIGVRSFNWVAVIILSVFIDPNIFSWVPNLHDIWGVPFGIREMIMFSVAVLAYMTRNKVAFEKNEFSFEPIREVGWLFLGIFLTMQPALQLISNYASGHADSLGVGTFYWSTGLLSGILDNAPTYLNFVAAAMGKFGLDVNQLDQVLSFANNPESVHFLQAISVAAVFFGAMSYIGNAPNFMVKAIAEANGVETPSFFSYIVRYSIPILLPIYGVIYVIFFSGWVF